MIESVHPLLNACCYFSFYYFRNVKLDTRQPMKTNAQLFMIISVLLWMSSNATLCKNNNAKLPTNNNVALFKKPYMKMNAQPCKRRSVKFSTWHSMNKNAALQINRYNTEEKSTASDWHGMWNKIFMHYFSIRFRFVRQLMRDSVPL